MCERPLQLDTSGVMTHGGGDLTCFFSAVRACVCEPGLAVERSLYVMDLCQLCVLEQPHVLWTRFAQCQHFWMPKLEAGCSRPETVVARQQPTDKQITVAEIKCFFFFYVDRGIKILR